MARKRRSVVASRLHLENCSDLQGSTTGKRATAEGEDGAPGPDGVKRGRLEAQVCDALCICNRTLLDVPLQTGAAPVNKQELIPDESSLQEPDESFSAEARMAVLRQDIERMLKEEPYDFRAVSEKNRELIRLMKDEEPFDLDGDPADDSSLSSDAEDAVHTCQAAMERDLGLKRDPRLEHFLRVLAPPKGTRPWRKKDKNSLK